MYDYILYMIGCIYNGGIWREFGWISMVDVNSEWGFESEFHGKLHPAGNMS
jgi:hypothetical protein